MRLVLVATVVGALLMGAPTTAHAATAVIPTTIRIPAIGVDSNQIMALGLNTDGTMQVPPVAHPMMGGWYTGAAIPGNPGTAVVAAHVDGDGQHGLFFNLSKVKAGDRIFVTRSDGRTAEFEVTQVAEYAKEAGNAQDGEQVFPAPVFFSNQSRSELHLVTCGGRFSPAEHSYLDSIAVYSVLVSLR